MTIERCHRAFRSATLSLSDGRISPLLQRQPVGLAFVLVAFCACDHTVPKDVGRAVSAKLDDTLALSGSSLSDGAAAAAVTGSSNLGVRPSCGNTKLKVVGVGEDLDGIFNGIEQPETGRRLTPQETVLITFDAHVNVAQVAAAIHVDGKTCMADGTVIPWNEKSKGDDASLHHPDVTLVDPITAWAQNTTSLGVSLDRPFWVNVFALGRMEGVFGAEGTVVAREDLAFHLPSRSSPTARGLIEAASDRFCTLTDALAAIEPTGITTIFPWGVIVLNGTSGGLNVFTLEAEALTRKNALVVRVPLGSTVIVNVVGDERLALQDTSLSLGALPANRLLWNVPNVRLLRLHNAAFRGSLLAPHAKFDVADGDFTGTLVARQIVGSGLFHAAQFDVRRYGGETPAVILEFPSKLYGNCRYSLTIEGGQPLNRDGSCLATAISIPFEVSPEGREPFLLETESSRSQASFRINYGVNLLPADAFRRYAESLQIPFEDSLEPTSVGLDAGPVPGTFVREWAQYHEGIPVRGRGYVIDVEKAGGYLRSALGGLAKSITDTPVPAITSDAAIERVARVLTKKPYPWIRSPNEYPVPSAKLEWFPNDDGSVDLAWEINLHNRGIEQASGGIVDASTGRIIGVFWTHL